MRWDLGDIEDFLLYISGGLFLAKSLLGSGLVFVVTAFNTIGWCRVPTKDKGQDSRLLPFSLLSPVTIAMGSFFCTMRLRLTNLS